MEDMNEPKTWAESMAPFIERLKTGYIFGDGVTLTRNGAALLSRFLEKTAARMDSLELKKGKYIAIGFLLGMWFMATLDLTDLHICVGECDGAGYDLAGPRK